VCIEFVRKSSGSGDSLRREIGPLIAAIGSDRFESQLLAMARRMTSCNHVSAISVPRTGTPRVIAAASIDGNRVARQACEQYITHFWQLDETNQAKKSRQSSPSDVLIQLSDAANAFYRRKMYNSEDWARTGSRITEKLSFWFGDQESSFKVNLYRNLESDDFRPGVVEAMADAADILLPLLRKHEGMHRGPSAQGSFADYVQSLQRVAPMLSRRELEVCAGISLGMTSEAIALTLGIKLTTVQTHRKRAYARLHISSQNELLKLLYTGSA
jgi:LuxR family transcriptional regulator, activator of tox operons